MVIYEVESKYKEGFGETRQVFIRTRVLFDRKKAISDAHMAHQRLRRKYDFVFTRVRKIWLARATQTQLIASLWKEKEDPNVISESESIWEREDVDGKRVFFNKQK
jgi:hypothetical protein